MRRSGSHMIRFVSITSLLIIITFLPLFAQSEEKKCLAVITDIKGDVEVIKANNNKISGDWGLQLYNGDRIRTARASSATLIFSNGNLVNLGANSSIEISGEGESSTEQFENSQSVNQAMFGNFIDLALDKDKKKDVGVLAGLRSLRIDSNKPPIELISPCNTSIITCKPSFEWLTSIPVDEFEIKLFNKNGLVWSQKVTGTKIEYPENAEVLNYGETYFWHVVGEALLESYKSLNYEFSVLTADKIEEVKSREDSIKELVNDSTNSSSYHSLLGAYYYNTGLLEEAITEFKIVTERNPHSAIVHEILGQLYTYTGKKDLAIQELKKALQLKE